MNLFRLVLLELAFRPMSAVLTTVICGLALSAVVVSIGLADFLDRQTKQIQRDIGLNIRILPGEASLSDYWSRGYATGVIPEEAMRSVADQDVANRLVPILQKSIPWGDGSAILTGIGQETFSRNESKKRVFGRKNESEKTVTIGSAAAEARQINEGDTIRISGQSFTVATILPTEGSLNDNRIHASLSVVQELLGMPGLLNEIRALECNCEATVDDPEEHVRQILGALLPGTQIVRQDRIADARRKQRQLASRIATVIAPLMIVLAAIGLFGLALQNANERKNEFGMLSMIGKSEPQIIAISCLRSALLGLVGGIVGGVGGSLLLGQLCSTGSWLFVDWDVQGDLPSGFLVKWTAGTAVIGSLVGTMAAIIPAVVSSRRDPAAAVQE